MLAVSITSSRTSPDSRPTTPAIGGRSVSKVPWPLRLLARRLGGSSGSSCGIPFFPRVLVHLIGLGLVVRQRRVVGGGQRAGPDLMPQPEQVLAADADLAGELRGGLSLGDAAEGHGGLG